MRMSDFIEQNREELESCIRGVMNRGRESNPIQVAIDDDDIEDWIANDEGLYNWALSCRVDFDGDEDDEEE